MQTNDDSINRASIESCSEKQQLIHIVISDESKTAKIIKSDITEHHSDI